MLKTLFEGFSPQGIIGENNKRMKYIDVAYLFGVFLVVLGHAHPLNESWSGIWMNEMNKLIYSFHMHFYFFLGGYLLVHSKSIDRIGYKKWAIDKILKFGIPYVVLTVLAYFPKLLLDSLGNTSDTVQFSLSYFLRTTFLEPRAGVWGHFWFITAFLPINLIWGLWRYYAPKSKTIYRTGLLLGLLISVYIAVLPINTDIFTLFDISELAIFYSLGVFFALLKPVLWNKTYKLLLGIFVPLAIVPFLYEHGNFTNYRLKSLTTLNLLKSGFDLKFDILDTTIINFIVSLCLVSICWCLAILIGRIKHFKLPELLSKYTFNIFVYGWPAQAFIEAVLHSNELNVYAVSAIMFVVGFAAPILIVYIYKKLKFIHCRFFDYLIGVNTVSISHKGDIKS